MQSIRIAGSVKSITDSCEIPEGSCAGDQGSCPFFDEMNSIEDDNSSPCLRLRGNSISPARSVSCPFGQGVLHVLVITSEG